MERRNTVQKMLVLDAVRSLRGHVTADEVYAFVIKNHPSIGKGTVYRNLNILSEENEIKKIEIPNGPDRYDFTLTEHYHALCVDCGRLFDVDFSEQPDLLNHINNTNGFKYLKYDILFKGICPDCQVIKTEVD